METLIILLYNYNYNYNFPQPRSQGFPFLSLGRREKALAPGGHMTFNTQI